jgi:hypothetical protein
VDTGDTSDDNTIEETNFILWAIGDSDIVRDYEKHTYWGGAHWIGKVLSIFQITN